MYEGFLPTTRKEMDELGIEQFDFIYITGDAYVDHPSFGAAIVTRLIESMGFTIGIISQPDWHTDRDFRRFGAPKYAFLVTAGNIDSMVAHYTAAKRKRSDDAYTAGGVAGKRPDRAVIVYCQKLREYFGDVPIAIGGLEASLRRFAHYDYWDDAVRPSVLVDSGADLLMYGMGEHQIQELCTRMAKGESIHDMHDIRGTCYLTEPVNTPIGAAQCPSFEQVRDSKPEYAKAVKIQYDWQDEVYGKTIIQRHGKMMLVQLPPAYSLTTEELDHIYSLPYMRAIHPSYEALGGVPGIEEVRFSITHNRGCFGYCNFCSIALHQGRRVTVRSEESVLKEAERITKMPDFKGYIHDVGGPTADFRRPSCDKQLTKGLCMGKKCLAPTPCPALKVDHSEYLAMLRKIRKVKGVKKVFIRSGIRYDYLIEDKDDEFMKELIMHHVSGQLKVAPEHCSAVVLDKMGKPHIEAYKRFQKRFYEITKGMGKEQYLVPYLMSSHPGSTLNEAIDLALFLKENKIRPEQVQDFYPTPGTISTAMFYTELDPYTMEKVYVPKTPKEKAMQRALLQYFRPQNREIVLEALKAAGRRDLIGSSPKCLVADDSRGKSNTPRKGGDKSWQDTSRTRRASSKPQERNTSSQRSRGNTSGNWQKSGKKNGQSGKRKH
ncbi:MAG: YgiQ family radical SAM protein [Ruminococcus sp.]|nr:YgiQ family radical SAM protein [Ruminococcus sp.]